VLHSLLIFFSKNHFYVENYLFHQRSIKSSAGFDPDLGVVTPTVLAAFWNWNKKFKNNQNNTNPSCCVILCGLFSRKNNKLRILQLLWKSVHKKELSCTKFYGFQAKWDSNDQNHGIVCSNDPILCTCVHLGMTNNVDLGSFNFRCTKNSFFIFLAQKMDFFVKRLPRICCKNRTTKF
jgi:hypothetical protein